LVAVISYTPTMTELWLNLHRKNSFQVADFIHSPKLNSFHPFKMNIIVFEYFYNFVFASCPNLVTN